MLYVHLTEDYVSSIVAFTFIVTQNADAVCSPELGMSDVGFTYGEAT